MADLASAAFSVLMIGHSLFGQTGPDMLDAALEARAGAAQVQAQIINGAPLQYNWEHSAEAEGVDARVILPDGGISHVILTEALPLANHMQWSDTARSAMNFAEIALAANPDTRIYLQETWHSLNSGTGVQIAHDAGAATPWRLRLDQDLAQWESILAQMRALAPEAASRIGLIPAGQAMGRLSDEIDAGHVPGVASIGHFFADDIHLNAAGHYFVSMVQYAVLTGDDPQGLPHRVKDRWGAELDGPGATLAAILQRVAWETVEGKTADVAPLLPAQKAEMPKTVASAVPQAEVPVGSMRMGMGLASVKDWSSQQPFIDVMKTARPAFWSFAGTVGWRRSSGIARARFAR